MLTHADTYGHKWTQVDTRGPTWTHADTLETGELTGSHMDTRAHTW